MKVKCILVGYVNEIVLQQGRTSLFKIRTLSCLSKEAKEKLDIKN